ncbi:MAG TPA: hypothetical protein VGH74_14365 [Planctomycetaceae bacterium]|jgi:hypothetical protein
MIYQQIIKGHEVYAAAPEIMRPDIGTSNFVGGQYLAIFSVDNPPATAGGQCVKDGTGKNRLFTVPIDAITAAFVAAEALIP